MTAPEEKAPKGKPVFDYAEPLINIRKLDRKIHDSLLDKNLDVLRDVDELLVNVRMLRAWVTAEQDKAAFVTPPPWS